MRMTESKPDDLQSLHQKGFIFVMDNKVCIVKDWHENNQLRADRYQQSKYLDDKKYRELYMVSMEDKIKDIPIYNKLISEWQPNGNQRLPQDRIGKVRIGEVNTHSVSEKKDFELFWNLYPRKLEKKKSKIKWDKLDCDTQNKILVDIPKRISGRKWSEGYIENPTTYLNGERWNDAIESKRQNFGIKAPENKYQNL
jgi:hypothetical protein